MPTTPTYHELVDGATLRLIGRAVLAGLAGGITDWLSGDAAVSGVVTAAILAAGEVFTPLNALVGVFKKQSATAGGR